LTIKFAPGILETSLKKELLKISER